MSRIIERRRRGIFGWTTLLVFWAWNGLMGWWMVNSMSLATKVEPAMSEAQRQGHALGVGAAFTMILLIWALGAVVFGLIAHFTRGRREFVTVQ